MVESGEGEVAGAGCEEGEGAGDFPVEGAEVAVLLAFLTDDCGDAAGEACVAVEG